MFLNCMISYLLYFKKSNRSADIQQVVGCWLKAQPLEGDLRCVSLRPVLCVWDLCACKRSKESGMHRQLAKEAC